MISFVVFQSPPKGESSNEENKEVSVPPASEPSSQETTPEKGKDTLPLIIKSMFMFDLMTDIL